MVTEIRETVRMDYVFRAQITTPTDFDPKKESLPMLVFLHGSGERGDDLSRVKIHGLAKKFAENSDWNGLRVITVSPQCPNDITWSELTYPLFQFIQNTAKAYNADPDRISITGLSMGGFGTWNMIAVYPDFFSAAAPICGGGMSWRIPANMKMPVRAFHGDADSVVPFSCSVDMVNTMNERGGHAELTVFPGCDHNSWDPAYDTTDVIEWLVRSRRNH